MPENNYFSDISNEFIAHYFELLSSNVKLLENMYVCNLFFFLTYQAENCVLVDGSNKFIGKTNVYQAITSIKEQGFSRNDNDKFIGQPYGKDEGIIITATAKIGSKQVNVTFILSEVDKIKHQFGIIFQLIYHC